jgi:Protein of unknown function (DUF2809)
VTLRLAYAIAAVILFATEVVIALFVHDAFIRPYVGDVLAVALVYTALRAVTPLGTVPAIAITLTIALLIEVAQALNLLGALGLGGNQLARIVLGGVFDWLDLAAYAAGACAMLVVETLLSRRNAA